MVQKGLSGGVKWWKEGLILDLLIDDPQDRSWCPRLCPSGSWEESDGSSPSSSYRPKPQICPPSWQWSAWSRPSIRPTIWPKKTRSCTAWWRTAPPWPSCSRTANAMSLLPSFQRRSVISGRRLAHLPVIQGSHRFDSNLKKKWLCLFLKQLIAKFWKK